MSMIVSTRRNSAFRSEDISAIAKVVNADNNRPTRFLRISFKSGKEIDLICKTIKERDTVFDQILEVMTKDYIK